MHSVGKFLALFRKLGLKSYQIGRDEGYGHQLMDRMAEQGFYLKRINNGSPAAKPNLYANLAAEWWSVVGELIEHRKIVLLGADEKLVAQLTSRRKLYVPRGVRSWRVRRICAAEGWNRRTEPTRLLGRLCWGLGREEVGRSVSESWLGYGLAEGCDYLVESR
jgi:hypothetical protein